MRQPPRIPKVRQYAEITLADGTVLKGYVFIEVTARVQDLLNDERMFFPFTTEHDELLLFNKSAIVRVRPLEE
jgi:hypothetical protein